MIIIAINSNSLSAANGVRLPVGYNAKKSLTEEIIKEEDGKMLLFDTKQWMKVRLKRKRHLQKYYIPLVKRSHCFSAMI